MAISNTNLLRTSKPIFVALVTTLFMLLNGANSAKTLSFTFNKFFSDQEDLILQGNATTGTESSLQLTAAEGGRVGRALYYAPVRLWESSAVVASFQTTFTFAITSSPGSSPADGLAFFIASPDTTIPPNSDGKLLGLFPNTNALKNSSSNQQITVTDFNAATDKVVAVEFDTYPNGDVGDPRYGHIGIDVNSIRSKQTTRWDWKDGKTATAHISYNSASKRLSVVANYPGSSSVSLSHDVELNSVLPQWVRVGLSASTGLYKQKNAILSWSFTSTLEYTAKLQKEDMLIASVV